MHYKQGTSEAKRRDVHNSYPYGVIVDPDESLPMIERVGKLIRVGNRWASVHPYDGWYGVRYWVDGDDDYCARPLHARGWVHSWESGETLWAKGEPNA